ncbi:MAG: tetratricopeptide repeat protein [Longimicrobiales bacterium]
MKRGARFARLYPTLRYARAFCLRHPCDLLRCGAPLLLVPFALAALLPHDAQAQDLARIDTLIAHGRFTDARASLAHWRELHPAATDNATADQQAHALMLTGRLASAASAAHEAYLALVLGYPTSAHAAPALLRLGQGLLASGQPERARGYLERLARDYPNATDRGAALLWLARAQRAVGRATAACATVRDALTLRMLERATAALLQYEEPLACAP